MKIKNCKLKIIVLSFALCVLSFALPDTADAGLIAQRPLYIGLTTGLVGYWSFDGLSIFSTAKLLDIAFAFAIILILTPPALTFRRCGALFLRN